MVDRHFPVQGTYNETRKGLTLTVPKAGEFTPEELVAMVLHHAVDISVEYAKEAGSVIPPPTDLVLTVPSFYTQVERRALLDAAKLANLNVLGLIDEVTAAALHYATDKNFDEEQVILFYNMGASSLQVSIVKFFSYDHKSGFAKPKPTPALQVLAKAFDTTLGGLEWDKFLVDFMADKFNKVWREKTGDDSKDIRQVQRPMTKLRLAANKAKHVLSANNEYPIQLDALHDDVSLKFTLTRDDLETMTAPLLERAVQPVLRALEMAEMTTSNLTGVELLGGGMRVPSVQTKLAAALEPVELGLHMNADESMALGAAFAGANVSTAFRVRHVGMTDIAPLAQQITLHNLGPSIATEETKDETEATGWDRKFQPYTEPAKKEGEDEVWNKKATLFKANSKMGVKKTIAFTHDQDVHCSLDYVESELHAPGSDLSLERFEISGVEEFSKEMQERGLESKPKVSLQFELSASGITSLVKAEASMEETYTVEEEVEVDDDDEDKDDNATETESSETTEDAKDETADKEESEESETESNETDANETEAGNSTEEAVPEKKKKKTIKVEKVRCNSEEFDCSCFWLSCPMYLSYRAHL